MRLIGPKCDQLGPITIVYLKSPNAKTNSLSTQDWVLSLDVNRFQKTKMKRRSCLPNDPKIVVCISFGTFWICNKVLLSYGRLTINFSIVLFTYTRWLLYYCITCLSDACGDMLFNKETGGGRNENVQMGVWQDQKRQRA